MQNDTLIAVDLAKAVFEIGVSTRPGKITERQRLERAKFLAFFVNRPSAIVIMEACSSAHYWAREIERVGHKVVLLPPGQVRPYVLRNKTDRTDVRGMLEAYRNEDIKPVPIKTVEQQVLGSLHRLRSAWVAERTAKINTLRGLLRELGFVIPLGAEKAVPQAWLHIEDAESGFPEALRHVFARLCEEIRTLDSSIRDAEQQLRALTRESPATQHLESVPGIGLLTATAFLAIVGDVHRFPSGRHVASFVGLTPREFSSGSTRRLGRISKRGDSYLRTLFVHGARATLWHAKKLEAPDRLRAWALQLEKTVGHNKAAVALANKMVRIAWAVLKHDRDYAPAAAVAA
jgi:transposase